MPVALIWLIAALVLVGAEALTGDMFLLMLGGGALAASVSSWLLAWPMWADGAVFLLVSVLLLVLVRPAVRRRLTQTKGVQLSLWSGVAISRTSCVPISRMGWSKIRGRLQRHRSEFSITYSVVSRAMQITTIGCASM